MTTADLIISAMQPYKLKQVGRGKYQSNSPLRPGSDSGAFSLLVAPDGEHGAFKDFVSADKGSLYELAERLGITVPKSENGNRRIYVENSKRVYMNLADYAEAHHVKAEVFEAAKWRDAEKDGRSALAFPTTSGERYRFIDGEKPTYINNPGYRSCLYGMAKAPAIATEHHAPLIICNGEASTVVAQFYGVPAVCQTGGERAWTVTNVKALNEAWKGDLIIALDCDDAGRRAAKEIAGQFGDRARVVDLGFTDGGDLSDFCGLWQKDALAELVRRAAEAPKVETQQSPAEIILSADDHLNSTLRKQGREKAEVATAIAQAQAAIDRVTMDLALPVVRTFADLVVESEQTATERREGGGTDIIGLRTNIPKIDKTVGGLVEELYTVYGATGAGKSWLLVSIARELLRQEPGLIVSTEMTPKAWFNRLIASSARADYTGLKHGKSSAEEWMRIRAEFERFGLMTCQMLDHSAPTLALIRAAWMQAQDAGAGLQWLVVDSASKMTAPGADGIYERTARVADGLQDFWREFNVPVIVSTQVGRDVAERPKGKKLPQLEDAYGGGRIEHNSGAVIALYNHHYYVKKEQELPDPNLPEGIVLARFLKLRDEYDGETPAVRLSWTGAGFGEHIEAPKPEVPFSGRKDHV